MWLDLGCYFYVRWFFKQEKRGKKSVQGQKSVHVSALPLTNLDFSFYSLSSSLRSRDEKEEMVSEIPFALIFYSIHKNPTKIQMQSGMEKVLYSFFKLCPRTVEWCLLSQSRNKEMQFRNLASFSWIRANWRKESFQHSLLGKLKGHESSYTLLWLKKTH